MSIEIRTENIFSSENTWSFKVIRSNEEDETLSYLLHMSREKQDKNKGE